MPFDHELLYMSRLDASNHLAKPTAPIHWSKYVERNEKPAELNIDDVAQV